MIPQGTLRVCQKAEPMAGHYEAQSVSQEAANPIANKGCTIHITVPSVVEVPLVGETNAEETALMLIVLPYYTVRLIEKSAQISPWQVQRSAH